MVFQKNPLVAEGALSEVRQFHDTFKAGGGGAVFLSPVKRGHSKGMKGEKLAWEEDFRGVGRWFQGRRNGSLARRKSVPGP